MKTVPRHSQPTHLQSIAVIKRNWPARLLIAPLIEVLLGRVMKLHHGPKARSLALLLVQRVSNRVLIVVSDAISVNTRPLV